MDTADEVRINLPAQSPGTHITGYVSSTGEESLLTLLGDSATITAREIVDNVRWIGECAYGLSASVGLPSVSYLAVENASLRQEIEHIKDMLSKIMDRIPEEKVIILQEMSREDAKQEIKRLFSEGKTLYYSDIAVELRLDLELIVDICNELQEQGEITIDARTSQY